MTVTSVLGEGSTFCFSLLANHFKPSNKNESDLANFKSRTRIHQSSRINKKSLMNPDNLIQIDERDELLLEDSDLESSDDTTFCQA